MKELIESLIQNQVTMVTKDRFNYILNHENIISSLEGDIVECGVWRGGMSIFLIKLFSKKKIWVCDSYEGCQATSEGKYSFPGERHFLGMYAVSLEEVKNNFYKYDALDDNRVFFLKGWVRDTLRPEICPIEKISLLRVDVDSYSATLEVLDYLYDKVITGGIIIFDDSCLAESYEAIKTFFKNKNIDTIYNPLDDKKLNIFNDTLPCGCYIIKK